ncbi:hypothetical protein HYFRA_00001857 [Hymenoscyphus fraxineus]|uniref:Uncharacterized protein n=1 Tax=Hymenoscyphus fraxineus TaxID=746836 RepID=A0A9N9KKU5_9HELO|nr:hypothetical protein HYFRA_00001857 [Hymenoscyphus fraxineus]
MQFAQTIVLLTAAIIGVNAACTGHTEQCLNNAAAKANPSIKQPDLKFSFKCDKEGERPECGPKCIQTGFNAQNGFTLCCAVDCKAPQNPVNIIG